MISSSDRKTSTCFFAPFTCSLNIRYGVQAFVLFDKLCHEQEPGSPLTILINMLKKRGTQNSNRTNLPPVCSKHTNNNIEEDLQQFFFYAGGKFDNRPGRATQRASGSEIQLISLRNGAEMELKYRCTESVFTPPLRTAS